MIRVRVGDFALTSGMLALKLNCQLPWFEIVIRRPHDEESFALLIVVVSFFATPQDARLVQQHDEKRAKCIVN